MNAVHPLVRDQLLAKDAMTFELGDALDTKASIALVVITFLGTQTAWFVTDRHVAGTWLLVQTVAALALIAAGALSIVALWPRTYQTAPAEKFVDWVVSLQQHYQGDAQADEKIRAAVLAADVERATERIAVNGQINELKGRCIERAFWASTFAFGLNLLTVFQLTITRLS